MDSLTEALRQVEQLKQGTQKNHLSFEPGQCTNDPLTEGLRKVEQMKQKTKKKPPCFEPDDDSSTLTEALRQIKGI